MDTQKNVKVDRRIVRTRKAIMNAFDSLLTTTPLSKITVSAIAREADIDRKTFYLHYTSISDLVDKKAEDYLERVFAATIRRGADKTPSERLHILLEEANTIIEGDIPIFESICSEMSIDNLIDLSAKALLPALADVGLKDAFIDEEHEVLVESRSRLRFAFAGALSLYTTWLKSGRPTPISTVSDTIESILNKGAVPIMDPTDSCTAE